MMRPQSSDGSAGAKSSPRSPPPSRRRAEGGLARGGRPSAVRPRGASQEGLAVFSEGLLEGRRASFPLAPPRTPCACGERHAEEQELRTYG